MPQTSLRRWVSSSGRSIYGGRTIKPSFTCLTMPARLRCWTKQPLLCGVTWYVGELCTPQYLVSSLLPLGSCLYCLPLPPFTRSTFARVLPAYLLCHSHPPACPPATCLPPTTFPALLLHCHTWPRSPEHTDELAACLPFLLCLPPASLPSHPSLPPLPPQQLRARSEAENKPAACHLSSSLTGHVCLRTDAHSGDCNLLLSSGRAGQAIFRQQQRQEELAGELEDKTTENHNHSCTVFCSSACSCTQEKTWCMYSLFLFRL